MYRAAPPRCVIASGQRGCWDERGAPIPCPGSGQDGELQPGIPWPEPRFEVLDGSVSDRLTGLVWSRSADLCGSAVSWPEALAAIREMNDRGPSPGRWRLPGITELESLLDASRCDPSLQTGHPFIRVGAGYWSSTTSSFETDWAMVLNLGRGAIGVGVKREPRYLVWPVCGP